MTNNLLRFFMVRSRLKNIESEKKAKKNIFTNVLYKLKQKVSKLVIKKLRKNKTFGEMDKFSFSDKGFNSDKSMLYENNPITSDESTTAVTMNNHSVIVTQS